jgi:predicted aspartyl protease
MFIIVIDLKKLILITLLFLINISVFSQELIDKIPIQLFKNLIFIELYVNDSNEPLNFMFDSGAGITVIDTKVANKLKLNSFKNTKIGTSGKSLETKESLSNKLKLSDSINVQNISLFLMDLSHISKYLKINVDGIIGFDILNQNIVETNIDFMEMRFFKKVDFKYNGTTLPLKLIELESNHFGLPIEIQAKGSKKILKLVVKIDTGAANYLTFHNDVVKEYNLIDKKKRYKIKKGFGADATITNNLNGKISFAKFASEKWRNIPVVFEIDSLNKNSKRKADGLIGQEMLLDFNILYNLNIQIIYLEKR